MINQNQFIMGFEESAISSIRGNRSLQRKQSAFYQPEEGFIGKRLLIKKVPVDEEKMQKIKRKSNLIEALFFATVLIFSLAFVYYLAT